MKVNRLEKVNSEIKKELSNLILNTIRNPKINTIISITNVETTPDLAIAKVFISVLDDSNENEILKELVGASGFLRANLAKNLKLRKTPRIIFELDKSEIYGSKIDNILKTIKYVDEENEWMAFCLLIKKKIGQVTT